MMEFSFVSFSLKVACKCPPSHIAMMSLPIALLVAAASALVAAAPVEALQPDAADAQPPHAADATYRAVERDATSPDGSPDGNRQQAEASIEQVERDLVRIATFADEVRRSARGSPRTRLAYA